MQIIVVGCGKVGRAIVAQLSTEDNNVTIVDVDADVVRDISTIYDVMGVVGNGTSYATLKEAGLDVADMIIAVTESDEVNLLTCVIAQQKVGCHTIARVRNPIYSEESDFLKSELHLSMTINPEYEAAHEMLNLIRFPNAIEVDSFAHDKIDLLRFKVPENSAYDGMTLKDAMQKISQAVLVCIAERGNDVMIPNGDFEIRRGDVLTIIISPLEADQFFRHFGVRSRRIRSVMIVGGGEISFYLTKMLLRNKIDVKIIERNRTRCDELNDAFPEAMICCADGTNQEVLAEEHIDDVDAFVSCTGIDEINAMLSMYAQEHVREKCITKINHGALNGIIERLELDTIVDPKNITAQRIIQYVRATGNSMDSNVETLYRLMNGRVEAMEFLIRPNSKVIGISLQEMHLKDNVLVAGIMRNGKLIIPGGQDCFEEGDAVIIVTTHLGFDDIYDIIAK
ncbi:MAG: Trk system potassium transporter TrkA [Eubacteriales bacterium]|jgi:trk system potassium uptake protein TrkA